MMSSSSSASERRRPQQARASLRRAHFLDVAAELFGKAGYEAVTMKSIAESAGASIGTLYDYFPDKQTLALALRMQYAEELDVYWTDIFKGPWMSLDKGMAESIADTIVEAVLGFVKTRPAYLPLIDSPVAYSRSTALRQPLWSVIAKALQKSNLDLIDEKAYIAANVIVELTKALLAMYARVTSKEAQTMLEEFRKLMRLYVADVIR